MDYKIVSRYFQTGHPKNKCYLRNVLNGGKKKAELHKRKRRK